MDIVEEKVNNGVVERRFDLKVGNEVVPGVIWLPEGATGARPKVLFGHGGSQHKKIAHIRSFAKRLADAHGFASVAIDAPDHGDRAPAEDRDLDASGRWEASRRRLATLTGEELKARQIQAVAEWQATIDAVEQLPDVGDGPTGYWGLSLGTILGVPLVADEPRIRCAVLGLMGVGGGGRSYEDKARSITVPLQFLVQWQDELVSPDRGVALYEAFGSEEKMLIANQGAHAAVPAHVFAVSDAFFQRHLGS